MQSFKSTIQYNSIWIFDNTALIYWCQLIICSFKCSLVSKPSHQKLSQGGKSDNIQLKAIFSNNKESCHRYMLVTQLSFHHLYNMRPMRTWGKWAFKSSSSASSTTTWRENRKSVSSSQETVISHFFQNLPRPNSPPSVLRESPWVPENKEFISNSASS